VLHTRTILINLLIQVVTGILVVLLSGTSMACRMYGALSNNLPDNMLEALLITDPNSLFELSHIHTDGWGIAYYPAYGDTPTIERGAIRAWNDPEYTTVVNQISLLEPNITLVHLRWCTGGCCDHGGDSIANPHPFYRTKNGKTWVFAHNGGVESTRLYTLIGDEYLNENGPYGSDVPGCTTPDPYDSIVISSELYFLHILKNIEENNWDPVNGIVKAVKELINDGETGGMIFLLSDGDTIWAFCRGSVPSYHTLYYDYNPAEGYSAVASQYPSNSQGNWQLINNNELAVFTNNDAPIVIDVTTFTSTTISSQPCTAEKIYGEDSEKAELLKYLRDNVLIHTPEGQEIIKLYYEWSPTIVKAMEEDGTFKEKVKEIIDGVLGLFFY